jgi:hypothetical protein
MTETVFAGFGMLILSAYAAAAVSSVSNAQAAFGLAFIFLASLSVFFAAVVFF